MEESDPLLGAAAVRPRRLLLLVILAASSFASTSCFACLVTFFPEEVRRTTRWPWVNSFFSLISTVVAWTAALKGASSWQAGFIFSVFQLGCLVASPLCGQFMTVIGSNFLLVSGLASLGMTTVLFGALAFSKGGRSFVCLSLVIRALQGISLGAHMTALLTTVANRFPDRVARVLGITESCAGMAFLVGPLVGGLLYQEAGFVLPFAVIGGLNLLLCPFIGLMCPQQTEESGSSSVGSIFRMLRLPGVALPLATILTVTITMSFLDLTLAPQMDTFGVSTAVKGLLFASVSATYAVSNVLWGKLADKPGWCKPIMMCGSFVNGAALLLLGPSPLVGINGSLSLMAVSLGVLGVGVGAQVVPPFLDLLQSAKSNGYADDLRTDALVSGLTYTFFPLGSFLGPFLGGFVSEAVSFPWSTTGLAAVNAALGTAFLIRRICQARWDYAAD